MTQLPAKGCRRRVGRAAAALCGALALALLGTTAAGAMVLECVLLLGGVAIAANPGPGTQAIVVLGGRTGRIRAAAVLHSRTGLPLLLTGKGTGDSGYAAESEKMAEILVREFHMKARWIETASLDTAGNARYSWIILGPKGVRRVAILTDARHLMRATLEFSAVGFQVTPVAASDIAKPVLNFQASDLLPSRQGYQRARTVLREWVALVPAASRWLTGHLI